MQCYTRTSLASVRSGSTSKLARANTPVFASSPYLAAKAVQQRRTMQQCAAAAEAPAATDRAALLDRMRGALWGIFIADALSMPVHWYYSVTDLKRDFGEITDYQAPKARHPSSIMSLSNTGGHGRGGQAGRIIGDVINHGKHQFWGVPNTHYHRGMAAGENTLNAICARVVMRGIAANGGKYDPAVFLRDYVGFMTTPGSHTDTYAESFHRDFFKNWAAGVPPERCALGTEGHNTAQIGGFVMLPPVIMAAVAAAARASSSSGGVDSAAAAAAAQAATHLRTTHDSNKLTAVAERYAQVMARAALGEPLRPLLEAEAKRLRFSPAQLADKLWDDTNIVHSVFGSACYIESSWPSVLYLAWKYSDSFEKAVLSNTNVGGENCHRGAALGALMGAAVGESAIPARLIQGLAASEEIGREIDAFCAAVLPAETPAEQPAALV
ncbi:ADP-ribosylglycohydrolase-domain-containing protein [Scenedesmus sp. NREL 46B-D3]|nr:ADP-ribosylglycohydrolase-domain-containing protein [Scenedesmus sp. NREL 46B-D3]